MPFIGQRGLVIDSDSSPGMSQDSMNGSDMLPEMHNPSSAGNENDSTVHFFEAPSSTCSHRKSTSERALGRTLKTLSTVTAWFKVSFVRLQSCKSQRCTVLRQVLVPLKSRDRMFRDISPPTTGNGEAG